MFSHNVCKCNKHLSHLKESQDGSLGFITCRLINFELHKVGYCTSIIENVDLLIWMHRLNTSVLFLLSMEYYMTLACFLVAL